MFSKFQKLKLNNQVILLFSTHVKQGSKENKR